MANTMEVEPVPSRRLARFAGRRLPTGMTAVSELKVLGGGGGGGGRWHVRGCAEATIAAAGAGRAS